jgi:hypothetical protein
VNSSSLGKNVEDCDGPTIKPVCNYTNTMKAYFLAHIMVETLSVGRLMRDPVQSVKLLPTYRSLWMGLRTLFITTHLVLAIMPVKVVRG